MKARRALFLTAILLASAVPVTAQVDGNVVCATNQITNPTGEPRHFCEPLDSIGFVQFDQFVDGLEYLESTFPDLIEVKVIGESLGGLPIYFVEVTNEQSPVPRDDKLQIGYSASIHANEAAGREGMTRMIEDLAAGIGPNGAELQPYLDRLIVNVWFPNPDSWAAGDYFDRDEILGLHSPADGVGFQRTNLAGVDLNREFPNPGLIHKDHTPMSEPESKAVVTELRFSGNHSNLVAGTDLHGMINSPNMIRSIIPNQDYDFRRMVLAVDMLRTTQERVEADPAFAEWTSVDEIVAAAEGIELPVCSDMDPTGLVDGFLFAGCLDASAVHDKPMEWGARWDMIGYTDTGFTSDYLMLSPRSPTGGMGAVGTITEFAYSHMVPDNKYVAKLTDMHVAGVRQIVRSQMELAVRLDTPVMVGTGPVAFLDDGTLVTSGDDPAAYKVGKAFDVADESTWFDFDQVDYAVSNLNFWRDLDRFTEDSIDAIDTAAFTVDDLAGYDHLVITNQVIDALDADDIAAISGWVDDGGHLFLTDQALQFFDRAGIGPAASQVDTYLGYTDIQQADHTLLRDVDWGARVTGEGPAVGISVGGPYPQWVLSGETGEVVGTTQGQPSLGRVAHGAGAIDYLGGALPVPRQVTGENEDHRYGLADYSVSALTYWIVMNSLGGEIEWQSIDTPFVPFYSFDPLYGGEEAEPLDHGEEDSPAVPILLVGLFVAMMAVVRRRA